MTNAVLALAGLSLAASGGENTPVFAFDSLLDSSFDEMGSIGLGEFDVVFAPAGPIRAEAAVLDAEGNVVARHPFFEEPRDREGVFARARVQGPANVVLATPGRYDLVLLWGGRPATRLPVVLQRASAGDDPFDPVATRRFDGPWRVLGHVTYDALGEQPIPVLNFWLGGIDLAPGTRTDLFAATLHRGEELVATSRATAGSFDDGHFERKQVRLYRPHERVAEAEAVPWTRADMRDGEYELKILRGSDGALLRNFRLTVAGGELQPHPRSALDYQPRVDYLAPSVAKRGSSRYEFVPAVWVESR